MSNSRLVLSALYLFLLPMFLYMPLYILKMSMKLSANIEIVAGNIFYILYFLGFIALFNKDLSQFSVHKIKAGQWPRLLAISALPLIIEMTNYFLFSGSRVEYLEYKEMALADLKTSPVMTVLCVVFLAPVIEEIFFRGFLYSRFNESNFYPLAIITSVIFSIIHLYGIWGSLHLFVFSLALFQIRKDGHDLITVIVVHALYNAYATIALVAYW